LIGFRGKETIVPTRNINLTEHFDHFVEHQLSSGRYSNASEIVRVALRLLEEQEQEREAKLKALRQAAKQGFDEIDQGKGIVLKGKTAISRFITEIEAEVRTKAVDMSTTAIMGNSQTQRLGHPIVTPPRKELVAFGRTAAVLE
jgi:antitoxin ParD1/3/4